MMQWYVRGRVYTWVVDACMRVRDVGEGCEETCLRTRILNVCEYECV